MPTPAFTRPDTTLAVTRGAARLLSALGHAAVLEFPLPNGRRADLMAIGRKGELIIVEVKSSPEDYLADRKWSEYRPYCDLFYFAVAPEFPQDLLAPEPGLIVSDAFGGAVLREAAPGLLAPARRRALTLTFARLAAFRSLEASFGALARAEPLGPAGLDAEIGGVDPEAL